MTDADVTTSVDAVVNEDRYYDDDYPNADDEYDCHDLRGRRKLSSSKPSA